MTNNITLTQSGTVVTIATTNIKEDMVNPLIIISIPSTDLTKITKVVNLMKVVRRFEVDGILAQLYLTDSTAATKAQNLKAMFYTRTKSRPITLAYTNAGMDTTVMPIIFSNTANVGIEKLNINEIPTDSPTPSAAAFADPPNPPINDPPQIYDVKMTLIVMDEV